MTAAVDDPVAGLGWLVGCITNLVADADSALSPLPVPAIWLNRIRRVTSRFPSNAAIALKVCWLVRRQSSSENSRQGQPR
jgi:hypothetical protein